MNATAIRREGRAGALRERVLGGGESRLGWLGWLLAVVGAANLIVLVVQGPALVRGLYANADNASALVLPALVGRAGKGAVVNLGNHPWYEPWWFMRATAGLAHYRTIWEAAPFAFALLGVLLVSVCAWYALGALAGLLCGVALVAASETLRGILYVPESHGAILLHVGALGGGLLVVHRAALRARGEPAWAARQQASAAGTPGAARARSGRRRAATVAAAVGVPLAAFTAAGATDQLLLVSGVAPFVLAPLLCWWRSRSKAWLTVSAFAIAVGAVSVLGGALITKAMEEHGVVHAPFPVDFVTGEALVADLGNVVATVAGLGGGDFFGATASGANLLTALAGVLTLTAFAAVIRTLWAWRGAAAVAQRGGGRTAPSGSSATLGEPSAPAGPAAKNTGIKQLFVAYWGLTLAVVLIAFALTSFASNASNGRYLIAGWAAVASLLGVLAVTRRARYVLVAGVALFGLLNVRAELVNGVTPAGPGPSQRMAGMIEHFALAHGASIGYSGYWEAAPVTWETDLRVTLRPVVACQAPTGMCQFYANNISTWYAAKPGIRTFLVTNTTPNVPGELTAPPPSLGRPLAAAALGEGLTEYVYGHDIAADLSS